LESMRQWNCKPEWKGEIIRDWKPAIESILVELYAFRNAVDFISKNYFEGHQILFPDLERDLTEIINAAEKTVNNFNESLANMFDNIGCIDLEAIRYSVGKVSPRQTTYIVDMAKAEALGRARGRY